MTQDERAELARLVDAEAADQPLEGQVAVAAVVLNRLRRPSAYMARESTLHGVIAAPGQFESISDGRFASIETPTHKALSAVRQAVDKRHDPTGGCDFFYNPTIVDERGGNWVEAHTETIRIIGDHVFSKGAT